MILKHMPSARFLAAFTPILFAGSLFAQEGGEAQPPGFLEDVIANAGVIGGVIVLISIISLALIIQDAMQITRDKIAPPDVLDEIESLLDGEDFQEAVELCEQEKNYLTEVVGAGLSKLGHEFETMQTAVREKQTEESVKLFQKIGWLSLISAIAPMMGLMGTVYGMFVTFGKIAASGGNVSPAKLADGIKGALVTTLLGLIVAIPTGIAFFYMRNRVIRTATEVNAITEDLFERFRSK